MNNFQTTAEYIEENNTATDEDKKFFEEMDYHSTFGKTFGAQTIWSIYNDDEYGEIKFGNPHPFGDNGVMFGLRPIKQSFVQTTCITSTLKGSSKDLQVNLD